MNTSEQILIFLLISLLAIGGTFMYISWQNSRGSMESKSSDNFEEEDWRKQKEENTTLPFRILEGKFEKS